MAEGVPQELNSTANQGKRSLSLIGRCAVVLDQWSRREMPFQLFLLVFMFLVYGVFLGVLQIDMHPPMGGAIEWTFNSMIDHLMHGRFDVDPAAVCKEGFLRNGHVYAYWGIWCALVRFPLWVIRRLDLEVTAWSCLIAVTLTGWANLRTLLLLRRQYQGKKGSESWIFWLMLGYILFGGSQIAYLNSSIYQEVVSWAVAFSSIFLYFAMQGLIRGFDLIRLSALAFFAGLALLTRVSTGIGLIAAFGLLFGVLLVQEIKRRSYPETLRAVLQKRFLASFGILAAFCGVTGVVNYFRWGNPLVFADFKYYLFNQVYTDRLARTATYGLFSVRRIPLGLVYYFFPLWPFRLSGGRYFMEATHRRLMDAMELPPSSFFLTDLFLFGFIAVGAMWLWRNKNRHGQRVAQSVAILIGLLAPCLLMLCAISMNFRYRMEFYPEFDFLAFLGLAALLSDESALCAFRRWKKWLKRAMLVSILASLVTLVMYKLSDFGPSLAFIDKGGGVVSYYLTPFLKDSGEFLRSPR